MQLSSYASVLCQRFVLSGFDNPKVHSVFKKFPVRPGNIKQNLSTPQLNDQQLDDYLKLIEEELRLKMLEALKNTNLPFTVESINNLLNLVRQSDTLSSVTEVDKDIYKLASILVDRARTMTIYISESAEREFRTHPSSENFFRWLATWKMTDAIGADQPASLAPPHPSLYNRPYTVSTGDTLSKIAQRHYGHANLWDIIWLQSGADFHPDLIFPNQRLILP